MTGELNLPEVFQDLILLIAHRCIDRALLQHLFHDILISDILEKHHIWIKTSQIEEVIPGVLIPTTEIHLEVVEVGEENHMVIVHGLRETGIHLLSVHHKDQDPVRLIDQGHVRDPGPELRLELSIFELAGIDPGIGLVQGGELVVAVIVLTPRNL